MLVIQISSFQNNEGIKNEVEKVLKDKYNIDSYEINYDWTEDYELITALLLVHRKD